MRSIEERFTNREREPIRLTRYAFEAMARNRYSPESFGIPAEEFERARREYGEPEELREAA